MTFAQALTLVEVHNERERESQARSETRSALEAAGGFDPDDVSEEPVDIADIRRMFGGGT